ncbi:MULTISPECIES: hypothetical protein [Pseudomonas]|jgi:hypothetical protein|uniref:Uncharacterized protein n=2 Tax=Pseudomonas TaxID=286 RepID=A0ABZ2FV20_9PSED|nr:MULTISPECIES: hypothetical protein [Pseudomonas]MBB2896595.1 hypothetical protein [Pseudomonas sp. AS2.8]MCD4865546.1 hypothetical protein [Pseudomonas sp. PLB05]MCI1010382.1 hypothetical protein [Pseudomonas oryzihabitans]MDC7832201.1 hypothetical protein [Pseudomonas benzopyrenica]MDH4762418.1 hypothetical protein [Pseudomonas sp. CBMAI 2609]
MAEEKRKADERELPKDEKPLRTEHAKTDDGRDPPSPNSPDRTKDATGYN